MNKYARAMVCVPCGVLKTTWLKLFHPQSFQGPLISLISPLTEMTLDYGGRLSIGNCFRMRDGAKIRVRKGAACIIGRNVSINSNNVIACHERIEIGDNVQFSPNVQVYDHDHDFRHPDGLKANHYLTSPIVIGSNVWIGANAVILRGAKIGDGCVVGAGCIVRKGAYPPHSVITTQQNNRVKEYVK